MHKANVLIVDDEYDICHLLSQAIEPIPETGKIKCCHRGKSAVEEVKTGDYQLLLLDIMMPEMTGIEVLKRIRHIDSEIEVIIITARATINNTIEALREGVFDYLKKPFDVVRLQNTVANAIRTYFLKKEKSEYAEKLLKANRELEKRKRDLRSRVDETTQMLKKTNRELEKRVAELQLLHKISGRINNLMFTDEILSHFCQSARETGLVDRIAVFLVENGGEGELILKVLAGFDMDSITCLPIDKFGKVLLLDRDRNYIVVSEEIPEMNNTVVLPVYQEDRNIGLLVIATKESESFETGKNPLFSTLGSMLAGSLVRAYTIEEQLRLKNFNESILNNISSGLAAISPEGEVSYLNPSGSVILKADRKTVVGKHWRNLFRVEADLFSIPGEKELTLPVGDEVVPVRITSTPFVDGLGTIAIFDDLTERKHIEEEMRKKEQLATIGEISAGIAHEIRNPLAGLRTTVELMQMKVDGAHLDRYFRIINDEFSRLEKMLEDFLKYGRPARPVFSMLDIGLLLETSIELVREQQENNEKGIFDVDIPPEGFECMADSSKIYSVFSNLIINALHAIQEKGDEGHISIKGSFRRLKESRAYQHRLHNKRFRENPDGLEVSISDNGFGIPPENFEKLLKPFFTTKEEGTGLGLAIVQRMIEEHSGVFGIESSVGEGTSCHVFLPLTQ